MSDKPESVKQMECRKLGPEPTVHGNCELDNAKLGSYTEIGICNFLENVKMGDYSYSGEFCMMQNAVIGKFANIAAMVRIGPTGHPMERPTLHHFTYRRTKYGFASTDDEEFFRWRAGQVAYVGHDTWIGHGAIIMPGVRIGDGSVVGSGAVVTKDVEPYTIVAGIPARPIRKRFATAVAEKLEEIQWWDWSHDLIRERLDDFYLPIDDFIAKYGRN